MSRLLYFIILIGLAGCMESRNSMDSMVLFGKIEQPLIASAVFILDKSGFSKVKINPDGNYFQWQKDSIAEPLLLSIRYGLSQYWDIYIEPGDSIHLSFDDEYVLNSLNTITFTGDRKIENEFLLQIKQVFNKESSYERHFYNCQEDEFISKVDSLMTIGMGMIDNFEEKNSMSKSFENFMMEYVNYTCAIYLNNYPGLYKYAFGHRFYHKSESFELALQESVNLDRPDLLNHHAYTDFLVRRISSLSGLDYLSLRENDIQKIHNILKRTSELTDSLITSLEVRQLVDFQILQQSIYFKRPGIEPFYMDFQQKYPNSLYALKLQEGWKEYKILSKGFPAPSFEFADVTGEIYSLDSFLGKWIYMDVWATWCGPCLAQQPRFEELVEKYQSNDRLVFLGISIDENVEAWKRMVKDRELGGVQLNIRSDPDNSFHSDYMITGVPKYLIIDPNGLVYDVNAKEPKNPELVDEIDYLLSR